MEPIDQLLIEFEEQERWRDLLGEVLAVLNRDGGHYQTKHGAGRAAIEGVRSHYQMLTTIDALQAENARLRERIRLLEDEPCPDCNGDGHWGKEPDGRYRSCETCGGHEDRLGSGKLRAPMLEEIARLREQRDKAEATLEMVKALADGYDWLSDGRGPYAYDDGRYDDDVRQFVGQLLELLPSGNWLGMREWEAKYRSTEAENARLREQAEALKAAILDIDAHSTAMGEDADGFIMGGYIVTVGSLHRALGAVGHTARKCSHEARCPTCAQAEALATALESVRDVVVDVDGRFLAAQKDVDSILQAMTEGDVHQIWKVADAALRAYRECDNG